MSEFLDDLRLERSAVVANSEMNRGRGLPAYRRELGFDPAAWLAARPAPQRWVDVGCGSGRALADAARSLPGHVETIGLDLVGYFGPACAGVDLVVGSVSAWEPDKPVDLVTAVHMLHYVGDKLAALTRMTSWLGADGLFAANFDASSIRRADGAPLGRKLAAALRRNGFHHNARQHRLTRTGNAPLHWDWRYLGADDHAGPNYTGQDSVTSHYS
ncbi:trans-aconitate 2-methyltransferase [Nocardia sp. BMG51109]|uniref:class I SAM-dependent methyltransferase n=1 Tax=Nocardia sp. BMG51109 TaxID=1056816 RepID=UPI001E548ED8|nr:methyltransferase domain-containing protein [Nocardia sp. BMG51109]